MDRVAGAKLGGRPLEAALGNQACTSAGVSVPRGRVENLLEGCQRQMVENLEAGLSLGMGMGSQEILLTGCVTGESRVSRWVGKREAPGKEALLAGSLRLDVISA